MPLQATYELDRATADDFFRAVDRAQKQLGKSALQSLQWGARLLCQSLGAQTKIEKMKLRPVVQNPDSRWKTDRRVAPFGVMGYRRGKPVFIPIYRGGEFGKLRFYDRDSVSWYERADGRSEGKWKRIARGASVEPALVVPTIMDHPRRIVPRRGLAKKTWQAASTLVGRGGNASAMGISRVASVSIRRGAVNPSVTIRNNLGYAETALKGGAASLNSAMAAATSKLFKRIEQEADKRLGIT
jgi:hypothetical protein